MDVFNFQVMWPNPRSACVFECDLGRLHEPCKCCSLSCSSSMKDAKCLCLMLVQLTVQKKTCLPCFSSICPWTVNGQILDMFGEHHDWRQIHRGLSITATPSCLLADLFDIMVGLKSSKTWAEQVVNLSFNFWSVLSASTCLDCFLCVQMFHKQNNNSNCWGIWDCQKLKNSIQSDAGGRSCLNQI